VAPVLTRIGHDQAKTEEADMPVALGALHILVAIYFAVHAVRHGRANYWLFVLLGFPFLGSVIYFFSEYLPEMRHSRLGRQAVSAVTSIVDPGRALREAREDFERTPSVEHRARLADALLDSGDAAQALAHYRACASGHHAKDAKMRIGLARAALSAGEPAAAVQTLQALFADEPERYAGAPALLLAHAHADAGNEAAALGAFDEALRRHDSIETRCDYGLYLARLGRGARARELLEGVMRDAKLVDEHARVLNRDSLDQARAALRALDQRDA
jgi:hypothetical protein